MPPIAPPPFDDAAAAAYETSLRSLSERLLADRRADSERVATAGRDWRGFSRAWFTVRHEQVVHQLETSAVQAAAAADDVAAARHAAARAAERYAAEVAAEAQAQDAAEAAAAETQVAQP